MPTAIFLVLAALTMISGGFQIWRVRKTLNLAQPQMENEVIPPELNGREDLRQFNPTRPYLINFSSSWRGHPEMLELVQDIRRLRNRIVYHFGFTLPAFDIEFLDQQAEDEFRFSVYEIPKVKGTFTVSHRAVKRSWLDTLAAADRESVTEGDEQRREDDIIWLTADHPLLQNEEVEQWSAREILVRRMENAIHASSPHFIGLQETRALVSWLESEQPELAQELQRVMPLSRFSGVLQKLVAERIPLRSVRAIAEALIEHGQHERDIWLLTDQVRISLKNHLCYQYARPDGLHVWLLTPELEEQLRDSLRQTQNDLFFALTHEQISAILPLIASAFPVDTPESAVLLVAQDLRSPLRGLIQEEFHYVPVLSFAELQPHLAVNVLGRIAPDPAAYSLNSWEN